MSEPRRFGHEWACTLPRTVLEQYRRQVYRYFARRVSCPYLAEDLAQEVCWRMLSMKNPDAVRKPLAYFYGIAFHVLADFKEARAREQQHIHVDSTTLERLADDPSMAMERDMVEMLATEQRVSYALSVLPPTHAAVLIAHKMRGCSHEEVAQELRLSIHTVEKYVVQAKAQLRGVLRNSEQEEDQFSEEVT